MNWFSPGLRSLENKRRIAAAELEALGVHALGQTAAQLGYQHQRSHSHPLASAWIQVDLLEPRVIDTVALIPASVDWQSPDRRAYAFPLRFRVDLSNDAEFKSSVASAMFTEEDYPNPGVAPVIIPNGGKRARYVRLTVTKLAKENQQYFYALSELMVLSGNLNVAISCPVKASGNVNIPPRWSLENLVDGRTPLGPPIRRELLEWDGLYAGEADELTPWMKLDLGKVLPLQQIRLHPIHARFGADVPGYSFPKAMRVEVSLTPDFSDPVVLFDSEDYTSPGNNPVTIWATNVEARYVRITATETAQLEKRFGLSEIEVYSEGKNIAGGSVVTRVADNRINSSARWPLSLLVDGFTSYGRLMELPEWLHSWERKGQLQKELAQIEAQEAALKIQAQRRAIWTASGASIVGLLAVSGFVFSAQHRRKRELRDLRLRLARDIHDDIGSNLAGIAVLSEVASGSDSIDAVHREDWCEINRIAQETMGAMREVLWLTGGREEAGLDFMSRLQSAAARMLSGKDVHWVAVTNQLPTDWPLETKRHVFLFFKEALANVVRHAAATRIELSARVLEHCFQLSITDNGRGFDLDQVHCGIGLNSQQMRANAIGGILRIESTPGNGTRVALEVPLRKTKYFPFRSKPRIA